jgi:hypothetical protein
MTPNLIINGKVTMLAVTNLSVITSSTEKLLLIANRVFTRKTAHIVTAATAVDTPRARSLTAFIVYPIWAL